jgi:hypothetical protein
MGKLSAQLGGPRPDLSKSRRLTISMNAKQGIVAENQSKKQYKIEWEGIDPETNEPWRPTWVRRRLALYHRLLDMY